jgi:DNA-binding NtrC family response regulator
MSDKKKSGDYFSNNNHDINSRQKIDSKHYEHSKTLARLLIVDDDYDIVHILKLGLQKNGFLVDSFTNPEEALQSFKSNAESYLLVLSDIRMPKLSGIQLARNIKAINPNVKVVLMTAFEIRDNEFSKVFPSTQVDGFVQKPIAIRDLANKIWDIIGETK